MTSDLKQAIRLTKIHERNLKPHYKHLTPQEKSFVKAYEKVQQCEKDMAALERYDINWRSTETGQNILEIYFKAINKKIKMSNKLNLTELKECELLKSCHTSRFYGGNF